ELRELTYGWAVEMIVKGALRGVRIVEVPVSYHPRIGRSKITGTVRGTIGAGWCIISGIVKYRLRRGPGAAGGGARAGLSCGSRARSDRGREGTAARSREDASRAVPRPRGDRGALSLSHRGYARARALASRHTRRARLPERGCRRAASLARYFRRGRRAAGARPGRGPRFDVPCLPRRRSRSGGDPQRRQPPSAL